MPKQHFLCLAFVALCGLGCVELTDDAPNAEALLASQEHLLKQAPTPRYPSGAVLENQKGARIIYLGADVDAQQATPGETLTVTHYFRVEKPPGNGWRLFVHIGTPDHRLHHNADHVPVFGKYPVSAWKAGDIIRDIQRIPVPKSFQNDKLGVFVGFFKKNERMAVKSGRHDGRNRVAALELNVKGGVQLSALRKLQVRHVAVGQSLAIDGKLDEPAWKHAVSSGPFVHTMTGGAAEQVAGVKLLWDEHNLYVGFEFADTDVWGTLPNHDDKLWTQEAAEVFLDPDGDGRTYVELQVSPQNVTFDSWLPGYRQNDNAWESGMQTGVAVMGTLNQRDDRDVGWTAEMRIPMAAVKGRLEQVQGVPPQIGTQWRANFFRLDQRQGKPQTGSAWSPPLVGDFHALDKFGTLVFASADGLTVPPSSQTPVPETAASGPHKLSPMLEQSMKGDNSAPTSPASIKLQTVPGKPTAAPTKEPPTQTASPTKLQGTKGN